MTPLRDLETTTFSWRPIKGVKGQIELHADDTVYATARLERRQPVMAKTVDQEWSFQKQRGGCSHCTILARLASDQSYRLREGGSRHVGPKRLSAARANGPSDWHCI